MRSVIVIFASALVIAILVGCSMKGKDTISTSSVIKTSDIGPLLDILEGMGFYKYIDPSSIDEVKKESTLYGYLFGDSGRDFTSDAEDLTEGGISNFYDSLKEFLKKQNVTITMTEDFSDKGYSINGCVY